MEFSGKSRIVEWAGNFVTETQAGLHSGALTLALDALLKIRQALPRRVQKGFFLRGIYGSSARRSGDVLSG